MREEANSALDVAATLQLARRHVRRTRWLWFVRNARTDKGKLWIVSPDRQLF
jgi:hypothetical protein